MATVVAADDWLRISGDDLLLRVRVQPRASRTRLDSIDAGALRLRVGAAPVDGGANRAVIELIAATLGLPRSRFSIGRGRAARTKEVRIDAAACDAAALRSRVLAALVPKA